MEKKSFNTPLKSQQSEPRRRVQVSREKVYEGEGAARKHVDTMEYIKIGDSLSYLIVGERGGELVIRRLVDSVDLVGPSMKGADGVWTPMLSTDAMHEGRRLRREVIFWALDHENARSGENREYTAQQTTMGRAFASVARTKGDRLFSILKEHSRSRRQ